MASLLAITDPTPRQAEGILALYLAEGWWDTDDKDPGVVRRMVAGSRCFLLAEEGGEVVGMGRALGDGFSDAYIQDVAVSPSHRGRGLGAALVEALVQRLKEEGTGWIGLIAEPGSEGFYEKLGFTPMKGHVPMRLGS